MPWVSVSQSLHTQGQGQGVPLNRPNGRSAVKSMGSRRSRRWRTLPRSSPGRDHGLGKRDHRPTRRGSTARSRCQRSSRAVLVGFGREVIRDAYVRAHATALGMDGARTRG